MILILQYTAALNKTYLFKCTVNTERQDTHYLFSPTAPWGAPQFRVKIPLSAISDRTTPSFAGDRAHSWPRNRVLRRNCMHAGVHCEGQDCFRRKFFLHFELRLPRSAFPCDIYVSSVNWIHQLRYTSATPVWFSRMICTIRSRLYLSNNY